MSRSIFYKDLSRQEALYLEKQLKIKPKTKDIPYSKNNKEPEPVILYKRFYGQDEKNNTEVDDNTIINIPMFFSYYKFPGKCFRTSNPQPRMLQFTKYLFDYQISINYKIWENLTKSILCEVEAKYSKDGYGEETMNLINRIKNTEHMSTVLLKLSTGFGKTILSICTACNLGYLTCILCPNKVICHQWKDAIHEFTNSSCWDMSMEKLSKAPMNFDFIVAVGNTRGVENHMPKEIINSVGTLIVDEAHSFCSTWGVNSLNLFQPYYLVMNTATPEREDGLDKIIDFYIGPRHRWISHINLGSIYVYRIDTNFVPETVPKNKNPTKCKTVDWHTMLESISTSDERNDLIVRKVIDFLDDRNMAAIITWRKTHVESLVEKFAEYDIKASSFYGNQSTYEDSKVLIGTNNKMGVGFDDKRINMIVIAAPFKNKERLQQVVGRGTRSNNLVVLDFVDKHNTCENQWKERSKWYNQHATCYNEKGRKIK